MMLDVSCRKDYTGAIKIMEVQCNMKLAFFDTKPYDKPGFNEHSAGTDIEIKYFETRLGEDTVQLAKGFDGVCVFVNDTVNEKVVNELYDLGVRVIALRCAARASTMWIPKPASASCTSSASRRTPPMRWRSTRWRCC